jgi:hypothetical protein
MAKKPKAKETSETISSLAGRIMAAPDPFEFPGMREEIETALKGIDRRIESREEMVPVEDITDQIITAIRPCFQKWIDETRRLAASALSQDETK